ncbi:hypothetical protein [Allostreptomyces psammosilenae]|uniref:Uncharacterized protein n=1 Tax=Allostreptomyces psammosilenae TaxID=1892865 RepID=A0A853A0M9_9ACTN|nr:hypothetical protein [Allostreptomyces psammosilenae]NYI08126.1 hypothetical protein [Allostreptomyces psammosilenae]
MSAPTLLLPPYHPPHPPRPADGPRTAPRPADPPPGPSGGVPTPAPAADPATATDPVGALLERHAELCAAATHPLEIAAGLEAAGVGDRAAAVYRHPDLFSLAEELHARAARLPRHDARPGDRATPVDDRGPWHGGGVRSLLHGLLYAAPGPGYAAVADRLAGGPAGPFGLPAGTVTALAVLLLGMAFGQGLAYRGHLLLGTTGRAAAARALGRGMVAGALAGTVLAGLLAAVLGAGPGAAVVGAGGVCYLTAATTLLVLGRERALGLALLPALAAGVLTLSSHLPGVFAPAARLALGPVASLLAGVAVAVALGLAALAVRRERRTAGDPRRPADAADAVGGRKPAAGAPASRAARITAARLTTARITAARSLVARSLVARTLATRLRPGRRPPGLPRALTLPPTLAHALHGAGTGWLITLAVFGERLLPAPAAAAGPGPDLPAAPAVPLVAALSLSMGLAEWCVRRYRNAGWRGLASSGNLRDFSRAMRPALTGWLAVYLVGLLALAVALTTAHRLLTGAATGPGLLPYAALLALGTLVLLQLLLLSCGATLAAVASSLLAAGAQTGLLLAAGAVAGGAGHPLAGLPGGAGAATVVAATQLAGCGGVALALLPHARAVLVRASRHR